MNLAIVLTLTLASTAPVNESPYDIDPSPMDYHRWRFLFNNARWHTKKTLKPTPACTITDAGHCDQTIWGFRRFYCWKR